MPRRSNSASMASKTSSTGITARLTHRTIAAHVTIRYPVMQALLPMRDVDEFDGVGDRTCHWSAIITLLPSCSPGYPYTPEAILIIRDSLRGKLRFRSQPFKGGKSLRPLGPGARIIGWRS